MVEIDQRFQQWRQTGDRRLHEIKVLLANDSQFKEQEKRVLELEKQLQPRDELQKEQQTILHEISNAGAQIKTTRALVKSMRKAFKKRGSPLAVCRT